MTLDRELQEAVLAALDTEPAIDAARIGVSVADGVVTLHGTVTPSQKAIAEHVARHIFGVRAVANDLGLVPGPAGSDSALPEAAANALEWDSTMSGSAVEATVADGWIRLTGTVAAPHQKGAAERLVRGLAGTRGVTNCIVVRAEADGEP